MKLFGKKKCLNPPANVPLTDTPRKLLATRLQYHSSGKIEVVETKFNLEEYNRIKPIIDKWFKK